MTLRDHYDQAEADIRDAYADDPAKLRSSLHDLETGRVDTRDYSRIPAMDCCVAMPWDCSCPKGPCENCGEMIHGPGLCGPCYGGR